MAQIENRSLLLEVDEQQGCFNIIPLDSRFYHLRGIRFGCVYQVEGRPQQSLCGAWRNARGSHEVVRTLEHGELEQLVYTLLDETGRIAYKLIVGIPREFPLAIWKLEVTNHYTQPLIMKQITLMNVDIRAQKTAQSISMGKPEDLGFFSNGWQSWSPSGWYRGTDEMNISRLGFLQHPMIYNPGTPLPRKAGVFSSDMFAAVSDRKTQTGFLVGFLSQKNHFGSILADLNKGSLAMWANGDDALLAPGASMETDWAVFTPLLLDHRAPMEKYIEAVARENHALVPANTPVGWCSWYHFYTKVTAQNIEANLSSILEKQDTLPVELVQIDDGYETQVGDWFTFKSTFPQGVKPLAEQIKQAGLIPGLWQAPFIVHPRSSLAQAHPDWLLRKSGGRLARTGFVWNAIGLALDLTVPEALDYAREVVSRAVHEWGFPYLKLDFLYAAAVRCQYRDRGKTRAQVMRAGMEALRAEVGSEVTLLGCGVPLGSAIGVVDAMRIGADVSGNWQPRFIGVSKPLRKEPSMPSARNSINNILNRANLNRNWWINDPDCLLIRTDTNLNLDEVRSLATVIALTGGSLLLSDDLPALPAERLRIAEAMLPLIDEEVRVIDQFEGGMPAKLRLDFTNEFDAWHVLCGFNWSDNSVSLQFNLASFGLDDGEYIFREFWTGETGTMRTSASHLFENVAPHGCVLLAVRRLRENAAQYLGSDLHLSQGSELVGWEENNQRLELKLRLPRMAMGEVFLRLPFEPAAWYVNDLLVSARKASAQVYRVPVEVDGFSDIRVEKQ